MSPRELRPLPPYAQAVVGPNPKSHEIGINRVLECKDVLPDMVEE